MRYVAFALATTTALFTGGMLMSRGAEAAPLGAPNGLGVAADGLDLVEDAQFVFGGRRYCWYDGGWQGPGWYWCGYGSRRGLGWGGGHGWQGWRSENRVGRDFDVRRRGGQFQGEGQVQRGQVQRRGQVQGEGQFQGRGQFQRNGQRNGQVQRNGQSQRSGQFQRRGEVQGGGEKGGGK